MSANNTIKISRNRWFRVQTRLVDEMKQLKAQSAVLGGLGVNVSRYTEAAKLRMSALDRGENALNRFVLLSETLQSIRECIARTSGRIQTLMSADSALKSRIELFSAIVSPNESGDLVSTENVSEVANGIMSGAKSYMTRDTFTLAVLDADRVNELVAKLKEMKKESFAVQEEIARLNQAPLSIELSPEGASAVRELLGVG